MGCRVTMAPTNFEKDAFGSHEIQQSMYIGTHEILKSLYNGTHVFKFLTHPLIDSKITLFEMVMRANTYVWNSLVVVFIPFTRLNRMSFVTAFTEGPLLTLSS